MSIEQNNPLAGTEALTLPPALSKPRLRRSEASQYLEVIHGITLAPSTLATMATRGGGPAFHKVNRTPLYPRPSLDEWAAEKLGILRTSTSEY